MTPAKKPKSKEKVMKEEGETSIPTASSEAMRKEAEDLMKGMFSEDVKQHMIKAGSEFLLGLEAMMPRSRISEETMRHYSQMRREFLLMAKSIIDSRLDMMEERGTSHGLRKIELE